MSKIINHENCRRAKSNWARRFGNRWILMHFVNEQRRYIYAISSKDLLCWKPNALWFNEKWLTFVNGKRQTNAFFMRLLFEFVAFRMFVEWWGSWKTIYTSKDTRTNLNFNWNASDATKYHHFRMFVNSCRWWWRCFSLFNFDWKFRLEISIEITFVIVYSVFFFRFCHAFFLFSCPHASRCFHFALHRFDIKFDCSWMCFLLFR